MTGLDSVSPGPLCFPGLRDAVLPSAEVGLNMEDIEEDVAAERETLIIQPATTTTSGRSIDAPDFAQLQTTLMEASKGVTEGTDAEYKRYAVL